MYIRLGCKVQAGFTFFSFSSDTLALIAFWFFSLWQRIIVCVILVVIRGLVAMIDWLSNNPWEGFHYLCRLIDSFESDKVRWFPFSLHFTHWCLNLLVFLLAEQENPSLLCNFLIRAIWYVCLVFPIICEIRTPTLFTYQFYSEYRIISRSSLTSFNLGVPPLTKGS